GIFVVFDDDKSGELDQDEFVSALELTGHSKEEAMGMFKAVDMDGSGLVSCRQGGGDRVLSSSATQPPSAVRMISRRPVPPAVRTSVGSYCSPGFAVLRRASIQARAPTAAAKAPTAAAITWVGACS
ncbi:hypothetical protein TSOC_013694, partial [Tetrabaena socialis]